MNVGVLVARVLLGAVLIFAGASKVGHAADLAAAIAGFRLLPPARSRRWPSAFRTSS